VITMLGNASWSLIGALLLWLMFRRLARRRSGALRHAYGQAQVMAGFVFAALAVSGLAVQVLKSLIGRGRPSLGDPVSVLSFHPFAFQAAWQSFPSGHSTTCFALAVALAVLWPRLAPTFVVLASWGALSRALLGVHWASDVLAGATLGSLMVWLVLWQFRKRLWWARLQEPLAAGLIARDLWAGLQQGLGRVVKGRSA
jgi:membrane-associated phospholipid phosphatase